jgi:hypothetical protein
MFLKRAMVVAATTVALSGAAFVPMASADTHSDSKQSSQQQGDVSTRENKIPWADFNTRKECDDAGTYNVYVAHTQGATGYTCESYGWIPSNDPRCNNHVNDDGCIGEWWKLYLITP